MSKMTFQLISFFWSSLTEFPPSLLPVFLRDADLITSSHRPHDSLCFSLQPHPFSFPHLNALLKFGHAEFLQIPDLRFSLLPLPLLFSRPGMLFTLSSGGHILFTLHDTTQSPLFRESSLPHPQAWSTSLSCLT